MTRRIQSLGDYCEHYKKSVEQPEEFWTDIAETFQWRKPWDQVVSWNFKKPEMSWFSGAQLNITENIFEAHLETRGDTPAIIWESNEPGEEPRTYTYRELFTEVCRVANALERQGITRGDRVVFYMPMVPEAAIAMLACARIGAVHSVVFAGFSAQSLASRINDCQAKLVLTTDENLRGAKKIPVKAVVDEALQSCPSVEHVVMYRRTEAKVGWNIERDIDWADFIEGVSTQHEAPALDAEDMLFILYTSGSTGKPKGIVHTQAGYMVYTAYTFENVFQYNKGDVYWCSADIGWITGHSYMVYGPLLCGATMLMFEGVPTYPDAGRFWEIIDRHKVTHFYTAPTAIRALQAHGEEYINKASLESLRVLGTVGEPINEDAWHWYHHHIGKGRCPIVDTWWQTETGGMMISSLAGIIPTKPSCATLPLPGVQPILLDDEGQELTGNAVQGNLCIRYPWPGMLRTTYGDHERCKEVYFSRFENLYFTGDGARRDEDGYLRILGRVDDVINVSGHRIGTAEVEDAIDQHPRVVEAAVVGAHHTIKGQAITAFVVCDGGVDDSNALTKEIDGVVREMIGPIASPEALYVVSGLPKTRSGKIMRRVLRKVVEGDQETLGDVSTLINPEIVDELIACVQPQA